MLAFSSAVEGLRVALVGEEVVGLDDEPLGGQELLEVREKLRSYCDGHGFFAASILTVVEMSEDGATSGRVVDAGQFLDGH